MIDLRTALILAGLVVFIIILVVSYDKHRLAKARSGLSAGRHRDRDGEWEEPLLSQEELDIDPSPPQSGERTVLSPQDESNDAPQVDEPDEFAAGESDAVSVGRETTLADERDTAQVLADQPSTAQDDAQVNEGRQIDFVARLPGKNVIKRDTALGIYRQYEYELTKPHRIFGLSHPERKWCDLEKEPDSARFSHFGLSLQLADRNGPVTESELNQFSRMVLRFSEVFGRRFKFSMSFEDALKEASTLDEFSKKYDALAILNILARDARGFRGRDIDEHARKLNMLLSPARNIYYKKRAQGRGSRHLYSLANLFGSGEFDIDQLDQFTTNGIMLFINIPSTQNPGQVFYEMIDDAKELCKRIDGKLVDQRKRGMTEKGLKRIAQQIREIATEMEREGIPPGSDLAIRLF